MTKFIKNGMKLSIYCSKISILFNITLMDGNEGNKNYENNENYGSDENMLNISLSNIKF